MKHIPLIFVIVSFISILLISCKSEEENINDNDTVEISIIDTNLTEYIDTVNLTIDTTNKSENKIDDFKVSKFICPQGDVEGNKDKPGLCPICEMELIENPDYINKTKKNK